MFHTYEGKTTKIIIKKTKEWYTAWSEHSDFEKIGVIQNFVFIS